MRAARRAAPPAARPGRAGRPAAARPDPSGGRCARTTRCSRGARRRRPRSPLEQQLGEVRAVLAGDSRDQRAAILTHSVRTPCRAASNTSASVSSSDRVGLHPVTSAMPPRRPDEQRDVRRAASAPDRPRSRSRSWPARAAAPASNDMLVRRSGSDVEDARAAAPLEQARIGVHDAAHVRVVAPRVEVADTEHRRRLRRPRCARSDRRTTGWRRSLLAGAGVREGPDDHDIQVGARAGDLGCRFRAPVRRDAERRAAPRRRAPPPRSIRPVDLRRGYDEHAAPRARAAATASTTLSVPIGVDLPDLALAIPRASPTEADRRRGVRPRPGRAARTSRATRLGVAHVGGCSATSRYRARSSADRRWLPDEAVGARDQDALARRLTVAGSWMPTFLRDTARRR